MSSLSSLHFSHSVQPLVLDQIATLLQEIAADGGFFLSNFSTAMGLELRHTIVVTPSFSALLLAQPTDQGYQLSFSFIPEQIEHFLKQLAQPLAIGQIGPNHPAAQTEFTLQLLAVLTAPQVDVPGKLLPIPEAQSLAEQAQLLNQVTQAIRQSLELPAILSTAVQHVRAFLQVDRLLIHQFDIPAPTCLVDFGNGKNLPTPESTTLDGITYESRAHDQIPSVLNQMGDHWINAASHLRQKYSAGEITAKDHVEGFPELAAWVKLPIDAEVKSELTIPVLVQGELWGLLIAHQCIRSRQWTDVEKTVFTTDSGSNVDCDLPS